MHLDVLLRRQSCVTCPDPPPCNCPSNQVCVLINRDCSTCASIKCITKSASSGSSSSSSSRGALAGAIVGALALFACAVALWYWYRRRLGPVSRENVIPEDIPAAAETVLKRPDPTEKPSTTTPRANNVDRAPEPSPPTQAEETRRRSRSVHTNPFEDQNSIQTAGTEGTNVIPIALVQRDQSLSSATSEAVTALTGPVRPARTPDLDLNVNLEHVNISREGSRRSHTTGISDRESCLSGASFSSEFLNEAPVIVNSGGAVRQVLNTSKAEVVKAPSSTSSWSSGDTLRLPVKLPRPGGSPLAVLSFGPSDMGQSSEQELVSTSNPFSDEHSTTSPTSALHRLPSSESSSPRGPSKVVWKDNRPESVSSQVGSIAEFGNATRVYIGANQGGKGPASPYRTAMGKLVSAGTLGEQQQRAIAHARAQAQLQGDDRRTSSSSAITSASTGLEDFPFVPPSPISNRPARTPPASPLGTNTFTRGPSPTPANQQTSSGQNPSPAPLDPPGRQQLGLSATSELSTTSTGLDSFTFEIGSNEGRAQTESRRPRQRASLDTLAITQDLSSYPLGFDRGGRDGLR
jgi:hypothetical protein